MGNSLLVGVNKGIFPIAYAKTDSDKAEERRLFYVALTRAQSSLSISYSKEKGASDFIELCGNHSS